MPAKKSTHVSLSETVSALSQNIIVALKEVFELACLEGRLAGRSLLTILAVVITISFLAVTTWIFLLAALTYFLTTIGLGWQWSLLLMVVLNLLLIFLLTMLIVRLRHDLSFSETRRQLNINVET